MSYEGFVQQICEKGHFSGRDCMDDNAACRICGGKLVWENNVDQTNWEDFGYIRQEDMKKFVIQEEVIEICSHCGQNKQVSPTLYRPPTPEETAENRTMSGFDVPEGADCDYVYLKDLNEPKISLRY